MNARFVATCLVLAIATPGVGAAAGAAGIGAYASAEHLGDSLNGVGNESDPCIAPDQSLYQIDRSALGIHP